MALPSNLPASLNELALLSDELWHLAGDRAVDASWYTKRGSLAAVYAAAELFMTTDTRNGGPITASSGASRGDGDGQGREDGEEQEEFAETRRFLRSRLAEAQDVGAAVGNVTEWLGFAAQGGVNVLRSKGFRI